MRISLPRARSGTSDQPLLRDVGSGGGHLPPVFLLLTLLLGALLSACVSSPSARRADALKSALSSHWQVTTLHVGRFEVLALHPAPRTVDELAVFIEGDGLAWLNISTPSADPTPQSPVALQMALSEPHLVAAYLGRPCQYADERLAAQCTRNDWTGGRYSAEIVAAMDKSISELKDRFQASHLILVGYSGGGAIAALVAARRKDVKKLVTVAAVLDHARWTESNNLSTLVGSLNPADFWTDLRNIPQMHFIGGKDIVSGMGGAIGYFDRYPKGLQPPMRLYNDFSHQCCWGKEWKDISPL